MNKVVLFDIGARGGIDERWLPYAPYLEVVGFDADPAECERLNAQQFPYQIRFLPYALGARDAEEAVLYVCSKPGCSSLLRPNASFCDDFDYGPHMRVVHEIPLKLSRLDTVCPLQPDVMKVDTQGTELAVLEGAGSLLEHTLAIELEVEFVEQYQNQALFADVDAFLREKGFMLRGIRRTYWRNRADYVHPFGGQLVHGDALYVRPDRMDSPQGHIILAAYRQYDLLARFGAFHLIPKRSAVTRILSRALAGYSNRKLRRLVDRCREANATNWHDPDFF